MLLRRIFAFTTIAFITFNLLGLVCKIKYLYFRTGQSLEAADTGCRCAEPVILDPFQQILASIFKICLNAIFLVSLAWPILLACKIFVCIAVLSFVSDLIILPILSLESWYYQKSWPTVHIFDRYLLNIHEMIGDEYIVWTTLFWSFMYYFSRANPTPSRHGDGSKKNYTILAYKLIMTALALENLYNSIPFVVKMPIMWELLLTRIKYGALVALTIKYYCETILKVTLLVALWYKHSKKPYFLVYGIFGLVFAAQSIYRCEYDEAWRTPNRTFKTFVRQMDELWITHYWGPLKSDDDEDGIIINNFDDPFNLSYGSILQIVLWFMFYECFLNIEHTEVQVGQLEFQRRKLRFKQKQIQTRKQPQLQYVHERFDPDWFSHCCLYGHKDLVKKMTESSSCHAKILASLNQPVIDGFRPIHLAIHHGHLSTVQFLISKFDKILDLSVRNDYEQNSLDIALLRKENAIVKLLLRQTKPEMSSLSQAIKTGQHQHIHHLTNLLKTSLEKYRDPYLKPSIERLISLCKESESKSTSKDRAKTCKDDIKVLSENICGKITKYQSEGGEPQNEKETQSSSVESSGSVAEVEKIIEGYSCRICFELMKSPERRIYACSNDHWICSICLEDGRMKQCCPSCREDFTINRPQNRKTSEQNLETLLQRLQCLKSLPVSN